MKTQLLLGTLAVAGVAGYVAFSGSGEPEGPMPTPPRQASRSLIVDVYQREIDDLMRAQRQTTGSYEFQFRAKRIAELQRKIAEERAKSR